MCSEGDSRQDERKMTPKRRMKTALQIQVLERVFAEEKYPSEAGRAGLSSELGLSDRQLQLWFCRRRNKDKKAKNGHNPASPKPPKEGEGEEEEEEEEEAASMSMDSQAFASVEVQLIAAVESQLGEPLKRDSPILGTQFDPLPPGAFSTPIAPCYPRHTVSRLPSSKYESKSPPEWQERRYDKNAVLDHYHGHPRGKRQKEKSSRLLGAIDWPTARGRTESNQSYERSNQAKLYSGLNNPHETIASPASFFYGNEVLNPVLNYQGRGLNTHGRSVFELEERSSHLFHRNGVGCDAFQDPFSSYGYSDGHFRSHQASFPLCSAESYIAPDKMALLHDQERLGMDRKRKSEEVTITKELEEHENRIRRDIEKQDMAMRKREEQLHKEVEKQSREKQRELERTLREKQHEEERIQRERKREAERMDKLMQKETIRIERNQRMDEIRRQKEATKMKAVLERAAVRRMARESVDLIDDERLELLEAAAARQGLPSIYLLDGETLQGLDKCQGFPKKFPPTSVRMIKLIAAHPWMESERNVNSLLMVWRFITTFADVLGLWPFTLDEFVQAFHDYDPRLLGEIHIALLKTLAEDIKVVACSSTNGVAVNQYTLSVTGANHLQLVQSAFAWGFDIREWHEYLNPLTWPEILRQFALSAGYGPKWKRHKDEIEHVSDENEGNDGEEAVNTLRSGAAVANAVAQMRGKGGNGWRQSGHCLTPGTVKYAAFHVLATAGSKGLTAIEVAELVQKHGLRDLSTTKAPEASITATLSRNTLLFKRVAPSTYCVRPFYRKSPEDAEVLLEAAREKIRAFQSEAGDTEKDTEDVVNEAEREEDCDEDADDVENDVVVLEASVVGKTPHLQCSEKERRKMSKTSVEISKPGLQTDATGGIESDKQGRDNGVNSEDDLADSNETEIDESHMGESWVQGLMEGEYSDLSIEERLNALAALLDIVNEGNTIRRALEGRSEAANAIKRQLWMEVQLDRRRRSKEEQLMKSQLQMGDGTKDESGDPPVNKDQRKMVLERVKLDDDDGQDKRLSSSIQGGAPSGQDISLTVQAGFTNNKSCAQLKADIFLCAEELFVYRSLPLGSDRRHNKYWLFSACGSREDPGCGRLYVEFFEDGHWEVINTEEALDALIASLDIRGIREAHLHNALQKHGNIFRQGMRKNWGVSGKALKSVESQGCCKEPISANQAVHSLEESYGDGSIVAEQELLVCAGAISIEAGNNGDEGRRQALERHNEFDGWLWSSCMTGPLCLSALKLGKQRSPKLLSLCHVCHHLYPPKEKHCPCCSRATFDSKDMCKKKGSRQFLPSRSRLLKAEIVSLEEAIPAQALKSSWTESKRKSWALILKEAISAGELLHALTDLEGAINREWLSCSYETSDELLKAVSEGRAVDGAIVLPWVPQTTAAVALRLRMFDAALFYSLDQKQKYQQKRKQLDHSEMDSEEEDSVEHKGQYEEEDNTREVDVDSDDEVEEEEVNENNDNNAEDESSEEGDGV